MECALKTYGCGIEIISNNLSHKEITFGACYPHVLVDLKKLEKPLAFNP